MSNKGNTTSSLISLPKGGGALSGLGEKFSPDLHTGTGNFSVPIALPAGRNGFQPQLSLGYSTGQGQGAFGLGWALGVPGVSRRTSKGIPRYRDADRFSELADVFVLSGAEDLVAVGSPAQDQVQYRPRTEGLFAEIIHESKVGRRAGHWRVRTKDGLVSYYGTNPDDAPGYPAPAYPADLEAPPGDPAVTTKPDDPDRVFAWNLTLTLDPFGNRIEYLYGRSRSEAKDEAAGHRWDVPVLRQIRYADRGVPGAREFLVTVDFDYEARPDPFSEYRAGFEIRHSLRCRAIRIRTRLTQTLDVKEYRFVYREDDKTRASLLQAVEVYGFDHAGGAVLSMPALELEYTRFEPEKRAGRDFFPVQGAGLPTSSLADSTLELVDLHGQGLPDILELGLTARYWRNLGGGKFDLPRPMRAVPDGLPLGSEGVQLLDADGDGRMDLLVTRGELSGYFPLRFGPQWDQRSFRRYATAPSFDLKDPEVRLLDLTGDGVTDALRSSTRLECYFNDPERGFAETRWLERRALADFPNVTFSDLRVLTADMSGDGLTDIVLVHSGSVGYWPNLGYGDFGPQLQMRNAPRLPLGYDPKRLLVGDVNGDGLADLIYVDDRRVHLWLNQNGGAWSDPIVIEGTPPVMHGDALRLTDLLGSGISGILWTSDKTQAGRDHYFFLDLTGGAKPYLLCAMRNNLGASTRVEYKPSTHFYLEDRQRGATPWQTTLPFPVQTVARVDVEDALSGGRLVTRYTYHHGYWDGTEREFRGFGRVEQLDAETFVSPGPTGETQHSPPLLSKSWFDQGPVEDEEHGFQPLDCASEYWGEDASQLGQAERTRTLLLDLERSLPSLTSAQKRRVRRDALRSLRGSLLRNELYALDGSGREGRPYTVSEGLFGFEQKAEPGPDDQRRNRLFFSHPLAQRTTQWERGDDPLTQLSFTHRYDDFGQLLAQTQIACPRGWRGPQDRPTAPYLATRALTAYAVPATSDGPYIHDRVARSDSFEILQSAGKTALEIAALDDSDELLLRIGQTLSFYDGAAFIGAVLGAIGRYGAVSRVESLVLTAKQISDAYGDAAPAYLSTGAFTWPAEYPQAFRETLPALAGYVHHDGSEPDVAEGYFAITQRLEHDFQRDSAGDARGLVLRQRDPLGHDTTLTYDYDLLPATVTDAAGLVTRAAYDLRFLRPSAVIDPNGNRQAFDFNPDGLVSASWVRGKSPAEGDQQRPSLEFHYDLFAFVKRGEPVSVASLRYLHHDSDLDVEVAERKEKLESREYSDGFGRILQTRSQGEELRFGGEVFGGGEGVLPLQQSDGAGGLVVGVQNRQGFAAEVLADEPIAYYRMNESVGAMAVADSSGHENHGTVSPIGITLGMPGLGSSDTAALFDGLGSGRIEVPNSATLNPPKITMEAWVRWDGPTPGEQSILEKESFAAPDDISQYALRIRPDAHVAARLRIGVVSGPPRIEFATSNGVIVPGAPTHIVATYDGSEIRLYMNGILDSATPISDPRDIDTKWPHSSPGDPEVRLAIGDRMGRLGPAPTDRTFKGLIDEVVLYDRALSANRIRAHVAALPSQKANRFAAAVLADEPIAYYRMNEPVGATAVADSSGHESHGTVSPIGITLGMPGLGSSDTAALFDGLGSGRIEVPNSAVLNPRMITMEAWVRWDGPTLVQQTILEKESYTGGEVTQYALRILPDAHVAAFLRLQADVAPRLVSATSNGVIVPGAPTHIVATYDRSEIRLYMDGILDSATPIGVPADLSNKWPHPPEDREVRLAIGDRMGHVDPPPRERTFKGLMDEVAIYAEALSADRIHAHAAALLPESPESHEPNVVVSGWQVYDNKGRVVCKYEPFFSKGWNYEGPQDAHNGQCVCMDYDPRGQVIRTLHPDGSEERVVHGVPGRIASLVLTDPGLFEPTPWEAYSYDANDNAGRTHADRTLSFRHCRDTPASVEVDALGRTIRSVERNCEHAASLTDPVPLIAAHTTRFRYDIQGNVTEIVDALNRVAFTHVYDFAKHALYTNSIDAGERRLVLNGAGMELERRDSKGALALQQYDVLERPKQLWARDGTTESVSLRGTVTYGDELPVAAKAAERNLLGKPFLQRDGAGALTFQNYDFKGNPLEVKREVVADSEIAAQVNGGAGLARKVVVNWDTAPALEGNYTTSQSYDALNRVTRTRLPEDEDGERKQLVPTYNRAGALEAVSLAGDTYVSRIAYNAKGQRVLVAYGNGYLTRYSYDPLTLRLARLRTERFRPAWGEANEPPSYELLGGVLQDFGYAYDLAGNILTIRDRATGSGIQDTLLGDNALDRVFEYDALSRLTFATGRESKSQAAWPLQQTNAFAAALDRSPFAAGTVFGSPGNTTTPDLAPQQTSDYQEAYSYDPAGNMLELWHKSGTRAPWSRQFGMGGLAPNDWKQAFPAHAQGSVPWLDPPSNRLTHVGDNAPNSPQTHVFDDGGNLLRENGTRHFAWNYADQMTGFSVRPSATAPASVEACYLYDSAGQRVKKWVRKSGKVETTVYVGGAFERHDDGATANNTVHVLDGQSRIATRRVGSAFAEEGAPDIAVKYHFGDHLGSSHVVMGVDTASTNVLVNREEFYPYGETSYGGFGRKRYRFTGMERDEESGLSYHGARYYAPWLARWASCDPLGATEGLNLTQYCGSNPLTAIDVSGTAEEPVHGSASGGTGFPDAGIDAGTVSNGSSTRALSVTPGERSGGTELDQNALVGPEPKPEPFLMWDWKAGLCREEGFDNTIFAERRRADDAALAHGVELAARNGPTIGPQRIMKATDDMFLNEMERTDQNAAIVAFLLPAVESKVLSTLIRGRGVVYGRLNPETGGLYAGQAKSFERYQARQLEHDATLGVKHDYFVLERVWPGSRGGALDVAEESWIRRGSGPWTSGGLLENSRHQMSESAYRMFGGVEPLR